MAPLCTLYGSLAIHPWGIFCAIGILLSWWFLEWHPYRATLITRDRLESLIMWSAFAALIGARCMAIIMEPTLYPSWGEALALWDGGLSSTGGIFAVGVVLLVYAIRLKISVLQLCDLACMGAPLLHVCMRIGCWFAGCCGGIPTSVPWATFDYELNTYVHPVQLYSACIYALLFLLLHVEALQKYLFGWFSMDCKGRRFNPFQPGVLTSIYLICVGIERLFQDIVRRDVGADFFWWGLTTYQWTSVVLVSLGLLLLIWSAWVEDAYESVSQS